MFDAVTSALIHEAPPLDRLDVELLPELLTRVHAWLAVLRLRLSEQGAREQSERQPDDSDETAREMGAEPTADGAVAEIGAELDVLRRLANTYEAYATARPDAANRAAAAYVAASAHQLLVRAHRLGLLARRMEGPGALGLDADAVASEISAVLLFLLAGYPSDALEAAAVIDPPEVRRAAAAGSVAARLQVAMADLARGALDAVLREWPRGTVAPVFEPWDLEGPAVEALWNRLLEGVRRLAAELRGDGGIEDAARVTQASTAANVAPAGERSSDIFAQVTALSTTTLGALDDGVLARLLQPTDAVGDASLNGNAAVRAAVHTYAGPHHLAKLLGSAGDRLASEAVVNVPVPPGVAASAWRKYVQHVAARRPFLWANHLEAVNAGYLHAGTSSVVSFPTGAGKSTLSELKIAATLLRGRRVVFLAPTRALVWQTLQTLSEGLQGYVVADSLAGDGAYHEATDVARPDVLVMTPERCLVYLGSDRQALADVGLVVFDECHLLHAHRPDGSDRRSVDAMFCLLGLLDVARDVDVLLLSAMVRNTEELAKWVSAMTDGRPCLAQSFAWKPTRQVRGCVVYDQATIRNLTRLLSTARTANVRAPKRTKGPPKRIQDAMAAEPFALFGLTHRWAEEVSPSRYALLPLLGDDVPLGASASGPWWRVTANKNAVAAHLAARMAARGIKVIVFVQNKDHCESVAERVRDLLRDAGVISDADLALTPREEEWAASAAEDMGSRLHVIRPFGAAATVHHALLLPAERRLSESVFARSNGVSVLVATRTVAQGMNLPAEAVIIAGDGRFDADMQSQTQLTAYELLNAAGRAGRAGFRAAGVVLVVPDTLVTTTPTLDTVRGPWASLRDDVFSKPDQCLDVVDPVQILLDRVERAAGDALRSPAIRYFLTRLPLDEREENPHAMTSRLLGRSLAAFRARVSGEAGRFQTQLEAAILARKQIAQLEDRVIWLDRIASAAGMPVGRVKQIDTALRRAALPAEANVSEWVHWLFRWLGRQPARLTDLVSEKAIEAATTKVERHAARVTGDYGNALPAIEARLQQWIRGEPLASIERALNPRGELTDLDCKAARNFVNRAVHEFAYVAGLITQVRRGQIEFDATETGKAAREGLSVIAADAMPIALAVLSACVREGVDMPEKLALLQRRDRYASRVGCHAAFTLLEMHLDPAIPTETFTDTRRRVDEARARTALA